MTRPPRKVLHVRIRGNRALVLGVAGATPEDAHDLAERVCLDPLRQRGGRGWVIPAGAVPDLQALAEHEGGWVIQIRQEAAG